MFYLVQPAENSNNHAYVPFKTIKTHLYFHILIALLILSCTYSFPVQCAVGKLILSALSLFLYYPILCRCKQIVALATLAQPFKFSICSSIMKLYEIRFKKLIQIQYSVFNMNHGPWMMGQSQIVAV